MQNSNTIMLDCIADNYQLFAGDDITMLDNKISTPLYEQLREKLQQEIESGKREPGSRFPTENELCKLYDVSRVTVRKALEELTKQGLLVRNAGKGTFVAEEKMQRSLASVLSYSEMCRVMGTVPGGKIIRKALENPTNDQRQKLQLGEDEQMLVIERLRTSDGVPTSLETACFSEDFFFLFDEQLDDVSLYNLIKERKGIEFAQSRKILEIVLANKIEARYLGINKGHSLLCITSVVEDVTGTYRHLSRQLCIADRFRYIV